MKLNKKGERMEPAPPAAKKAAPPKKGKTAAELAGALKAELTKLAGPEAAAQAVKTPVAPPDTAIVEVHRVKGGPKLVPAAEGATPINKRITPGAHVDEWRIARSLRVGKPGFFLQGGFIEKQNGKKFFRVAEEEHYISLNKAKEALVAKYPAATPVGEASEVS